MTPDLKPQVLVVEDHPRIRMMYAMMFKQEADPRYDVVMFENAELGLRHFKTNAERIAVVSSDFNLGEGLMDGGAFLRKVVMESAKYDPPLNPLKMMVSAQADDISERDKNAVGLKFTKPVSPSALINAINNRISNS